MISTIKVIDASRENVGDRVVAGSGVVSNAGSQRVNASLILFTASTMSSMSSRVPRSMD